MSQCSNSYMRCLQDPFSGPLAGIPDYPVLQTRKARYFAKGSFSTSNTTGFGYIVFTPETLSVNDVPAGSLAPVDFSTAAFPLAQINILGAGTGLALGNSDYASASFGAAAVLAEYRIVAAGLRFRYIGTELNMGGSISALHEPNHQTLNGATLPQMLGYPETMTLPVTRRWTNIVYKPVLITDQQYKNQFPQYTGTQNDVASAYMAAIITAPVPTVAMPFEFQAYVVVEFNGRNIQGRTPSYYDPLGYAMTQNWALHALKPSVGEKGGLLADQTGNPKYH